jgi:hypothetical protein
MAPGTFSSENKKLSGIWYRAPFGWIAALAAAFIPVSRRSERPRLVMFLLVFVAVQALVMVALRAPSLASPPPQSKTGPAPASSASMMIDRSALDALRGQATMGDSSAGILLVGALLDSYERAYDSNDLLEAVQWMDRSWATGEYQQSGLASRVFERHCNHKVLRWHSLCDHGE